MWHPNWGTKKPCTTKDGKKCQLPFIYQGEKHEVYPQDPHDPNETWCSTLINVDGEHIGGGGHYGFCGDSCPKKIGSIKFSENDEYEDNHDEEPISKNKEKLILQQISFHNVR